MAGKLAQLAEQIARIEADTSRRTETLPPVPLACPPIDAVLPGGGLARGAVHEMMGPGHDGSQQGEGALVGFAAVALARLMQADEHARPALWCMNRRLQQAGGILAGWVYPPGLQMMGVPVERLLLVFADNDADTLWAMEEALRSKAVSAVLGELNRFEPMAARRLQLAAQAHATTALALWPGKGGNAAGFAESRWRLANLPSPGPEIAPHWRVTLMRARRSGARGEWAVRWRAGGLLAEVQPQTTLQATPQASPQPAVPAGVRGVSSVT